MAANAGINRSTLRADICVAVCLLFLLGACATNRDRPQPTCKTLKCRLDADVGKNIADVIAEKRLYPDSSDPLPNGNTVYRFSFGSGGRVDEYGNFMSNVCKIWLETKPDGTIVRYRYENCRN